MVTGAVSGSQARRHEDQWARFRTTVAFIAATGIAMVCLSYRDLEPNRAPPFQKTGDYFANLAPREDTIASSEGTRGFVLLQNAAATSQLEGMGKADRAVDSHGSEHLFEAGGFKFRTQRKQVDFLSARQARDEMKNYWNSMAEKTRLENGGSKHSSLHQAEHASKDHAGKGPLTANEARMQLQDFWKDLGSHDHVKSIRDENQKMKAAARLERKSKQIRDPHTASKMNEMERIWSSESGKTNNKVRAIKAGTNFDEDDRNKIYHNDDISGSAASVHDDDSDNDNDTASGGTRAGRFSSLPMCAHCTRLSSLNTWPVWNHRVDHALRVAENIAQGSPWNKTLHHVTLGSDAPDSDSARDSASDEAAGVSDAELKLQLETAMSSLRAAMAESKAEEVEEQAQERGQGQQSLSAVHRTQCLSVCYSEVQSLMTKISALPPQIAPETAVAAPAPKSAVAAVVKQHSLRAPSQSASASMKDAKLTNAADSIEKVVDSVEEAVGDSEEEASKSGGSGMSAAVGAVEAAAKHATVGSSVHSVEAAVGAVEAAVDKVVVPVVSGHFSDKDLKAAASANVASALTLQEKAKQALDADVAEPAHVGGGHAAASAADATSVKSATSSAPVTPAKSDKSKAAASGVDIRKLEDSALDDAAKAQEQVRQGEAELKHLKLLLKKAHGIKKGSGSKNEDAASSALARRSSSVTAAAANDAEAGLGYVDDVGGDGLLSPKSQALVFRADKHV